MKEILSKWWLWLTILVFSGLTYFFIISMTFALHPTEIHFYANEEMVATSKEAFSTARMQYFNECQEQCFDVGKSEIGIKDGWLIEYDFYQACLDGCENTYNNVSEKED